MSQIHWLHNQHITRNDPLLTDQKGSRSKQLPRGVSAVFVESVHRAVGDSTWWVWPQQHKPLCRGIVIGRLEAPPLLFNSVWAISFSDSQAFEQVKQTWLLVTLEDVKSQSSHFLINPIVQSSHCWRHFQKIWKGYCDSCESPSIFSVP